MKLVIEGGTPVRREPFAPWPLFAPDEIAAVNEVLASGKVNYWTGTRCREFERAYAEHTGRRHAIALANGTLALELALHAFGIGAGDDVLTTCRTFIASASCSVARGARPVLADVDPVSQNVTAETLDAALTPSTKAIVAVHLAGWPCEMDKILAFAQRHNLIVIEDCAQAHGARYKGKPVGSFGHAAAFSFCQDKIISTGGEGGMLVLDDEAAWTRAWAYKDHGKSFDAVYRHEHPPGFRWLHESFGTNWRMTEMQAAIGLAQLAKLDEWVAIRRRNAAILEVGLASVPGLRLTPVPESVEHAYYRYYAFVRPQALKPDWDRQRIIKAINAEGVPCHVGSCGEIYREKAFTRAGFAPDTPYPVAHDLGETSLAFLVHPTLTKQDMGDTVTAVAKVFAAATRPGVSC